MNAIPIAVSLLFVAPASRAAEAPDTCPREEVFAALRDLPPLDEAPSFIGAKEGALRSISLSESPFVHDGFKFSACAVADQAIVDACVLAQAPSASGEIWFRSRSVAVDGRVYPRLSELPLGYTGCQVLWATVNGKSSRTVTHIRDGKVLSVVPEPVPPLCLKGERAAATGCTSRRGSLLVSYPSGCVARMANASFPPDCVASFMREHSIVDSLPEE